EPRYDAGEKIDDGIRGRTGRRLDAAWEDLGEYEQIDDHRGERMDDRPAHRQAVTDVLVGEVALGQCCQQAPIARERAREVGGRLDVDGQEHPWPLHRPGLIEQPQSGPRSLPSRRFHPPAVAGAGRAMSYL